MMKRADRPPKFILILLWSWLGLFCLLPLSLMFLTSFLQYSSTQLFSWHFSLQNYLHLAQPIYIRIFLQSFEIALISTLLCLIIAFPVAWLVSKNKTKHRYLLLALIIIPFWTSSLVRSYAMMSLLKTKGIMNQLLIYLHIIHQPLQLLYSNGAVITALVYNLLPFMILPLYSNLEQLDKNHLYAAADLGASKLQTFKKIILPLSMPGIMAGCVLVFLPAMTLFYIPVLLGGAKSLLLGNLIEYQFLFMHNWPLGAATSCVLTLFMLLLIALYRHIAQKRLGTELL